MFRKKQQIATSKVNLEINAVILNLHLYEHNLGGLMDSFSCMPNTHCQNQQTFNDIIIFTIYSSKKFHAIYHFKKFN